MKRFRTLVYCGLWDGILKRSIKLTSERAGKRKEYGMV